MGDLDLAGRFQRASRQITGMELVEAQIASSPSSVGDQLFVKIPSFDGGRERMPVAGWMPRGSSLPTRGDTGIVAPVAGQLWLLIWASA